MLFYAQVMDGYLSLLMRKKEGLVIPATTMTKISQGNYHTPSGPLFLSKVLFVYVLLFMLHQLNTNAVYIFCTYHFLACFVVSTIEMYGCTHSFLIVFWFTMFQLKLEKYKVIIGAANIGQKHWNLVVICIFYVYLNFTK